jgi:hypothetical protein
MRLDEFYTPMQQQVAFTREQASRFAKEVADDFNPIHDPGSKMFCVPGDLLFSVALSRCGLSQNMRFTFSGMVADDTALDFPTQGTESASVTDNEGKEYLRIEASGETTHDQDRICTLAEKYVEFSGHTFPHILVPLMSKHGVMINPSRPLVIYESMEINLDRVAFEAPELELKDSLLEINGKKGSACVQFRIKSNGSVIGEGAKYMSLRGLRPFDQESIDGLVEIYLNNKRNYYSRGGQAHGI